MKSAKSVPSSSVPIEPAASVENPARLDWVRWAVGLLLSVHLLVAISMIVNHVSRPEIVAGSDGRHMQYFHQFAEGGHCYYPRNDVEHVTDAYTPLASEIFGWTIKIFGTDIRWVRLVAALFGLGGIWLVGACVKKRTNDLFLAYAAAALAAGIDAKWYLDVGPNTVHVTFSLLALYFFLRDPALSWKTLVAAGLALFASFWSKQLGLAYMAAGTVYVLAHNWRKGLWFGGGLAALSLIGILHYQGLENSLFTYWVFEMPQHQPLIWSRLWTVLVAEVLARKFAVSVGFVIAGLLVYERSWRGLFRPELLLLGAAAVAGGFANNKYGSGPSQMWVFYQLLIIVGLTYAWRFRQDRRAAWPVLGVFIAMQGLALADDPRPYYINDEDAGRYRQLMALLRDPAKSTYFINRGYMSLLAGKPAWPQAGEDSWYKGQFDRNQLSAERRAFLARDPWDVVIIDVPLEDNSYALYERLDQAYRPLYEIPAATRFANTYDLRYKKIVFEKKK